jgi:chitosanase
MDKFHAALILLPLVSSCEPVQEPPMPMSSTVEEIRSQITDLIDAAPAHISEVPASLTPAQKQLTEKLISLFENSTTEIQYGFAKKLNDGRGITCGRAGFTTATGDAYEVVKLYSEKNPNNPLVRYLPELKLLAEKHSASTEHLKGFVWSWSRAAKDPQFREIQDQVVDRMYFQPSVEYARRWGLKTPLSIAIIYDTIIQHGDGDDPDGLQAIYDKTLKLAGAPNVLSNEQQWLGVFLDQRRLILKHANNPTSRQVWALSVSRVDVWREILESGNFNLTAPIKLHNKEYPIVLR